MLLNSDIANSDINKYTVEFLANKWMITVACVIGLIFIVLYAGHKISQENKIKYAIFVQNGYSINFTNNLKKLELAYSKAEFILSYSSDISECIKLNFPKLKTEIIKIKYSIASNSIKKRVRKKRNLKNTIH